MITGGDVGKDSIRIAITPRTSDDPGFITKVETVANQAVSIYKPRELYLIHVKRWFDHSWLKFSGKILGALGVWESDVTVPPFHPKRIHQERKFICSPQGRGWCMDAAKLHKYQHSAENLNRKLSRITESGFFVWFSGETLKNGKGSIMAYLVRDNEVETWFATLDRRASGWMAIRLDGIGKQAFATLSILG